MDSVWLLIALGFGLVAQQFRLPPLVGFLLAGFVLNAFGEQGGELLELAVNYGIYLLLFSIGLKLRLQEFLEPAIGGGAISHMMLVVVVGSASFLALGYAGVTLFSGGDWTAAATGAFALSFSSTVFAVKIFEERGETRAPHAVIAVGILIIQDVIAAGFLLVAEGKLPSIWALTLLALPLARPLFLKLLVRVGHGEVLVLFGLAMTALGAELFEAVGMKPEIGVLVFGLLLSGHAKTTELSKSLLGFKDFFLLGFFLSIGLTGLPTVQNLLAVVGLLGLLLPLKMALFFWLLTRFNVRARSAFLATLGLATFSEFGLIVAREGLQAGLISGDWMVVVAIATAVSLALASMLNIRAHELFERYEGFLLRFETASCIEATAPVDPGDAAVLIVGMGRVGRGAYRSMRDNYGMNAVGVDVDEAKVEMLRTEFVNVIQGDAEDMEFWRQVSRPQLQLVMLALPTHEDMLKAAKLLRQIGFSGRIGAVSRYDDERLELVKAGVDSAYNYYQEIGTGFADHIQREMGRAETGRAAQDSG